MRRTGIALLAAVGLAVVAFAPAAAAAPKTYTAAQVAKHSSASSCWTIVGKNVYDVTKYVAKHPGGAAVIKSMCGKDGSAMFRGQHAGESSPTRTLARYRIGTLATSSASSSASGSSGSSSSGSSSSGSSGTVITAATVAQHASPSDCWTTISGRVYNLTSFIASHPGGVARIITLCGINGTSAFSTQHAGNQAALAALAPLIIGTDGTVSVSSASTTVKTPAHATQADDDDDDNDDNDDDSDSDRDSD
jgi:cytochrome b involved in lipid metabolism